MSMSGRPASSAEQRRRDLMSDLQPAAWQADPEPGLQALVRAACQLSSCPAGALSLLEGDWVQHAWRQGFPLAATPREAAVCTLTIESAVPLLITDLQRDDRLPARQLARQTEGWRFYAAWPVRVGEVCVGSFCVLDTQPRQLDPALQAAFAEMALAAGELLTGRLHRQRLVGQVERECRTRRDMLSQLSHELRTPLNAILGFAQLMAQDPDHPLPAPQRLRVQRLIDAGDGLVNAFSDLLNMTRGGTPLRTFDLTPQPVVDDGVASGRSQTREDRRRAVLYIEDEPLNVLLMQEIFRSRPQWQLHVAETGQQGVEAALSLLPDLVLVDMNLPDFNGIEVLRRLRSAGSSLHCVVLSADAMPEQVQSARDAGFRDYWTKPVQVDELLHALTQTLG